MAEPANREEATEPPAITVLPAPVPDTPAIPERYLEPVRERITLSPRAQNIQAALVERMVREGWADLRNLPDTAEVIELVFEHAARTLHRTRWDDVADESREARKAKPKAKRRRKKGG